MRCKELETAMPLDSAPKHLNMVQNLLQGETCNIFDTVYSNQSNNVTANNKITQSLTEVTKHVFNNNKNAWRCQRNYMCYYLMFNKTNFNTFRHHLNELNKYLPHFLVQVHLILNCVPVGLCKKLTSQFEVRYRINGIFFCGWAKNWEPAKMPGEISQFLHHPPTFKSFGHVDFVLGEHEEHKLCNKCVPSKRFFYLPNKNLN